MKSYLLLMLTLFLATGSILAQEKVKKEKKTIVIIEKTIDENGNEVIKKTIKEGDEIDDREWDMISAEDGKVVMIKKGDSTTTKKEISVEVEEEDGLKKISIKITENDGEVETINWQGSGEFSEEFKKELEAKGVHVDMLEGEDEDVQVFINTEEKVEGQQTKMMVKVEEDEDESHDLLLNTININIESNPSGKKINLSFKGKSLPTSVSLIDETGKQVYHSFMKDFQGMFNQEINVEGAVNATLELHIKQGTKEFTQRIK